MVQTIDRHARPGLAVSIIIVASHGLEHIRSCLDALAASTHGADHEIIVVDDAGSDAASQYLAGLDLPVTVIFNPAPVGLAQARNQGAVAAYGRNLVFLSERAEVTAGWLEALLEGLEHLPSTAVVGAKLLYPDDGGIQHAGVVFNPAGEPYHLFRNLAADHRAVNDLEEFQAVSASCLLIRREAFFAVGGFHQGYANGYQDADLCLKVREAGLRVVYNPAAVVYLHQDPLVPASPSDQSDHQRLLQRWDGKLEADENRYLAKIGIRLEYDEHGAADIRPLIGSDLLPYPSTMAG